MRFTKRAETTVKAVVMDSKGTTDAGGRPVPSTKADLPLVFEREGTSIHLHFDAAVTDVWVSLYDLEQVTAEMRRDSAKETEDYYGR